jgi:hypothetical protein
MVGCEKLQNDMRADKARPAGDRNCAHERLPSSLLSRCAFVAPGD